MRVLLTTDSVGGVWTFTRELTAGLLRRGHEVVLVSLGRHLSEAQTDQYRELIKLYFPRIHVVGSNVPLEWMQSNGHAFDYGPDLLTKMIHVHRPDLLHFNQLAFGDLPAPHPTHPGWRLPRLATVHSDILSWGAALRPNGFEPALWLQRYLHFVPKSLVAHDALVAPTRWMADQVLLHYPGAPAPEVILNGRTLPAHSLPRPNEAAPVRKLQAVTAGRLWDEAKNTEILTRIKPPMPIHIAGEQTFYGREPNQKRLDANLILHDQMEERELFLLFRESALYLATSAYEPFGLAPLEAALCGCAVVANHLSSLREVWGDAALYFRSAGTLADLLTHLAKHPDRLAEARQRSMDRARELTVDRMIDAYIGVYERLLSTPSLAGPAPAERDGHEANRPQMRLIKAGASSNELKGRGPSTWHVG